jgi:hypothetical protein
MNWNLRALEMDLFTLSELSGGFIRLMKGEHPQGKSVLPVNLGMAKAIESQNPREASRGEGEQES